MSTKFEVGDIVVCRKDGGGIYHVGVIERTYCTQHIVDFGYGHNKASFYADELLKMRSIDDINDQIETMKVL